MITKDGTLAILDKLLQDSDFDAKVRVAKNNPSTADADLVLADLTEADFGGYAAQATAGLFPSSALNGASEAESDSPTLEFTATGAGLPQTCYLGYIDFKDQADTRRLLAVGRFPTAQTVTVSGDKIRFTFNLFAWNGTP